MTTTKHKGMIFTGESVRAILAGKKTMTRRVLNDRQLSCMDTYGSNHDWYPHKPGDVIYSRETFLPRKGTSTSMIADASFVCFRDGSQKYRNGEYYDQATSKGGWPSDAKWRSPIHQPRWAARLWLRITAVKAERVKDISDADIRAEGIDLTTERGHPVGDCWLQDRFSSLWDSINGKTHSWESNPWIWAYAFEKAEKMA